MRKHAMLSKIENRKIQSFDIDLMRSFCLLFILIFPISVFAEAIHLKSGKTIEGKIIEKTAKYIKIDFHDMPLTFFKDEIESIDDQPLVKSFGATDVEKGKSDKESFGFAEANKQSNVITFEDWSKIKDVHDYSNNSEGLMRKLQEITVQQARGLEEAMRKNDRALGEKIIVETGVKISALVESCKKVNVPAEFKNYHDKVMEELEYLKMATDGYVNKDIDTAEKYTRMANMSAIEAVEMIKKLYVSHGAPQEVIDATDKEIAAIDKEIADNR